VILWVEILNLWVIRHAGGLTSGGELVCGSSLMLMTVVTCPCNRHCIAIVLGAMREANVLEIVPCNNITIVTRYWSTFTTLPLFEATPIPHGFCLSRISHEFLGSTVGVHIAGRRDLCEKR